MLIVGLDLKFISRMRMVTTTRMKFGILPTIC